MVLVRVLVREAFVAKTSSRSLGREGFVVKPWSKLWAARGRGDATATRRPA
jgi:hypothetical protein